MKTLKLIVSFLVLALASASAQTILGVTTLSSAVTTKKGQSVVLASGTGIAVGVDLIVDQEVMNVTYLQNSTGTSVTVVRGYGSTQAQPHLTGTPVVVVPTAAIGYALVSVDPQGACARGSSTTAQSTLYLPIYNTRTGEYTDCINGVFISGVPTPLASAPSLLQNIPVGTLLYTSVDSNGVALAATTDAYCAEMDIPSARWLTGVQFLNGTSVATDSRIGSLYDANGNLLAASAIITATNYGLASEYGKLAFTQLYPAQAGKYLICAQPVTAAGTASVRMALTQINDYIVGGIVTVTAGTANATITAPTTFTTAQSPYGGVY